MSRRWDVPTQEKRLAQQSHLAQLNRAGLVLDGSVNPYIEDIRAGSRTHSPHNGYDVLADYLYYEFLAHMSQSEATNYRSWTVRFGFRVIGRLLNYAPSVYNKDCQIKGTTASKAGLVAILNRSEETANRFARIDSTRNSIFENNLGLNAAIPWQWPPFRIENKDGLDYYVPAKRTLEDVKSWLDEQSDDWWQGDKNPPAWRKCPAREEFMASVWHQAIDRAAADPALFESDLAQPVGV